MNAVHIVEKVLWKDDEFLAAFNEAKARIRLMDFRFVEENRPEKAMHSGNLHCNSIGNTLQQFRHSLIG